MNRILLSALLVSVGGALSPLCLFAEPVAPGRIRALPASEQPPWNAYLERSHASALADQAAVRAEVAAAKLTNAIRAPDGGDFKLPALAGDPWYSSDEAGQLARVVLSYQTPAGGWSKHTGYGKGPRQPGMQWTSQNEPGRSSHYVSTFDNRATTEEMYFLACVWRATKRDDCQAGLIKGLKFILASQFPNGGWPQVYPLEGGYHDNITFNDDAMTRILELLQTVTRNEPSFAFLDESQRRKAADALARGISCLLRAQIIQDGKKTAWCAQHDPLTLQPAAARPMEPVALSGLESARILDFLMTITNPSPATIASIEGGLAWLEKAKIKGLAGTKTQGKTAYESNPASTEVYWARFYNLTNDKPVFPGRDGILYDSYEAMAAKNKLEYDFLSMRPASIINNAQKRWRKMLASQPKQ